MGRTIDAGSCDCCGSSSSSVAPARVANPCCSTGYYATLPARLYCTIIKRTTAPATNECTLADPGSQVVGTYPIDYDSSTGRWHYEGLLVSGIGTLGMSWAPECRDAAECDGVDDGFRFVAQGELVDGAAPCMNPTGGGTTFTECVPCTDEGPLDAYRDAASTAAWAIRQHPVTSVCCDPGFIDSSDAYDFEITE